MLGLPRKILKWNETSTTLNEGFDNSAENTQSKQSENVHCEKKFFRESETEE